jgi:transcriptional regulator of acetoin/glycerol metabolism
VTTADLPQDFFKRRSTTANGVTDSRDDHDAIIDALEKAHWNKTQAARLMGVSRRTLYRKLQRLGTK